MQPRPMAETTGPSLPKRRVFMAASLRGLVCGFNHARTCLASCVPVPFRAILAPAILETPMATVRILGLDPGLARMGWGVVEMTGTRLVHVGHGVLTSDAKADLGRRL